MDPLAEFEAQETLKPGEPGWWRVWGARTQDIRPGDIVMSKVDGEVETIYIEDTFKAKAYPLRHGIIVEGEKCTIGAMTTIYLVRRGTKNTLA